MIGIALLRSGASSCKDIIRVQPGKTTKKSVLMHTQNQTIYTNNWDQEKWHQLGPSTQDGRGESLVNICCIPNFTINRKWPYSTAQQGGKTHHKQGQNLSMPTASATSQILLITEGHTPTHRFVIVSSHDGILYFAVKVSSILCKVAASKGSRSPKESERFCWDCHDRPRKARRMVSCGLFALALFGDATDVLAHVAWR